jgi:hypothetical protein
MTWTLAAEQSFCGFVTNVWRYGEEAVHTDETVWTLKGIEPTFILSRNTK